MIKSMIEEHLVTTKEIQTNSSIEDGYEWIDHIQEYNDALELINGYKILRKSGDTLVIRDSYKKLNKPSCLINWSLELNEKKEWFQQYVVWKSIAGNYLVLIYPDQFRFVDENGLKELKNNS